MAIPFASLFSSTPPPLLGVDVSQSSVKLVELSRDSTGEYTLERCGMELLESGWVVDGNIEKFDEVANVVDLLVKKTGAKAKNAALALPSSAVITKRIVLPAGLSEEEMEVQVEAEAHQYIPFAIEDVVLDFAVIGPNANTPEDVDVLIAASRREKVSERESLALQAGLKPTVMDIDTHAAHLASQRLIHRLANGGENQVVVLFQIGAMAASMQVVRNDQVVYERDQAFGGAQLTHLIVRQYGFSHDEAESKKRSGDLPDDFQKAVLQPFVENMAADVERALQFFFTSTPYNRADHVFLAGGSAALEGLAEAVTVKTGIAAQVLDPFKGMQMGSAVRQKKLRREAPSYLRACGLAMRRFD